MSTKNKQAKRASQKLTAKAAADLDEPDTNAKVTGLGLLIEIGTSQIIGSCLLKFAPKIPHILQKDSPLGGGTAPASPPTDSNEKAEAEAAVDPEPTPDEPTAAEPDVVEIFSALKKRLTWHNALGLAEPQSGVDATALWNDLKGQELDMGPRKSRKGTPGMDRILANLSGNFVQYMHLLLLGFMLSAVLFRSWFSCLPWLFAYQVASVMIPLETLPAYPQVPLSAIPLKFRVATTMGIHTLLWFFFFFEAVWKCNFFIEFVLLGGIIFHAYAAKPGSSPN